MGRTIKLSPKAPGIVMTVSPQRCWKCDHGLSVGEEAIAHRLNPVVFCVPCAGEVEKTREDLCPAKVVADER